jgi:hypothetical protein
LLPRTATSPCAQIGKRLLDGNDFPSQFIDPRLSTVAGEGLQLFSRESQ